ncbi:unnamed protein product [Sphenostylis stenocarpa]|uniref:Uncharacterized protein n=1 Tax=Sphenostylis stenocarpa TaxID=92480 RepID=A0AA86S9E2_9FABA|nr:unnamed protein product [Sphenostylis stenocarpa]
MPHVETFNLVGIEKSASKEDRGGLVIPTDDVWRGSDEGKTMREPHAGRRPPKRSHAWRHMLENYGIIQ